MIVLFSGLLRSTCNDIQKPYYCMEQRDKASSIRRIQNIVHHSKKIIVLGCILLCLNQSLLAKDLFIGPKIIPYDKINPNQVTVKQITNIELSLKEDEKLAIKIDKEASYDKVLNLSGNDKEISEALKAQKEENIQDIKLLWEAAVKRSPVIQFALDKLSTPREYRRLKSSKMAKSLATLISGASILPSLFGAGDLASMGTYAGGGSMARILANKNKPGQIPLSDTELIQLASLIDSIQEQIIQNYYTYLGLIRSLVSERNNLQVLKKDYEKALANNELLAAIVTSSMYDKALLSELKLLQELKLCRVKLERLSGQEVVLALHVIEKDPLLQTNYNLSSSNDFNFKYRENLILDETEKKTQNKKDPVQNQEKVNSTHLENTKDNTKNKTVIPKDKQ